MKRALAVLALCVGLVGSVAGPASAAGGQARQLTGVDVTGTFETALDLSCDVITRATFDLTFTGKGARAGTLSITGCIEPFGGSGRFRFLEGGTFVLTASNGATTTGTASGPIRGQAGKDFGNLPLELTLTVQSGTKQFKSLEGTQFSLTSTDFRRDSTNFTSTLSVK